MIVELLYTELGRKEDELSEARRRASEYWQELYECALASSENPSDFEKKRLAELNGDVDRLHAQIKELKAQIKQYEETL